MRPLPATFALLLSATVALASPADARADTACHNYSPPYFGNTQVQLGNNGCVPLTGVKVTVAVTQDIKVASSTGSKGFSMQLNANGASSGLTSSQQFWQQFVIMVGAGSSLNGVEGFTQQWSTVQKAGDIYPTNPMFMGAPSTVNNSLLTIPAGTTFTWTLATDSHSNVESVTYSAHDNLGTRYTAATEYIPAADRTPIYSVTIDIVGYTNLSYTSFQTGAGTITYEATSLSASYDYPSCASNTGTGESSDMGYGPVSGKAGGVFTQDFFATTAGNFANGDCGNLGYPLPWDWAPTDYKAVCPVGQPMYGVSRAPGKTWTESVECGMPGHPEYSSPGFGCYPRTVRNSDNRGDMDNGWDGTGKLQDRVRRQRVRGRARAGIGSGALADVLCCPSSVKHRSCDTQVFYNGDSSAYSGPDWDSGNYKGQCPAGQNVAGISTPAYSSVGIFGAAHAVLCCSP